MKPERSTDVVRLPVDRKARRERQLAALWSEEDRLQQQLREIRAQIAPLQRDVSRDRGYLVTLSREQLERPDRSTKHG